MATRCSSWSSGQAAACSCGTRWRRSLTYIPPQPLPSAPGPTPGLLLWMQSASLPTALSGPLLLTAATARPRAGRW
eukprot:11164313-Heterocapsa_arctica.AAC.1